jgi:hypothetical protein
MKATSAMQMAFDYASLDTEARIVVQQRTSEIKGLMRKAAQDIIDIGQKLIEVKARLPHGHFGPWLEAEFEWSEPTAQRFMRVCGAFQKRQIDGFAPSALYLLAAPSTPEAAREEALSQAEAGERITHQKAQGIIEAVKASSYDATEQRLSSSDDLQEAVDTAPNGKVTAAHVQQVIDQRRDPEPIRVLPEPPPLPMVEPPEPPTPHAVHYSSATPEWYTPAGIIDRVLAVLGHIDLDPCSNAHGDAANVPARFHYTKADDGLASSWAMPRWVDDDGCESDAVKVYMNPPYGTEIGPWIERLCDAYETGEITEAIALVPARVDTAWFQPLFAYALCFVRGRLKFVGADDSAPFPSVVVYLGPDAWLFRDVFGAIGRVGVLT